MCRCRGSLHGAAAGSHSPSQTVSDPAPPATPHVCLSSSWHITYPSLVSESSTLLPQTRPCSLPGKPSARLSIPSTQTHMHMDTIYNIYTLSQAPAAYEHVQVILIWPCSPRRRSWPRAGSRETRPHQGWPNRAESHGRASRFGDSAKCAPRRFGDSAIR